MPSHSGLITLRPGSYLGGYFSKISFTALSSLLVLRDGLELIAVVDTP
jgi:hypothetical protein